MIEVAVYSGVSEDPSDYEPCLLESEHQVVSEHGFLICSGGWVEDLAKMVGKHVPSIRKSLVDVCKSTEDLTEYGFVKINDYWYNQDYHKIDEEVVKRRQRAKQREADELNELYSRKKISDLGGRQKMFTEINKKLGEIEGAVEFIKGEEEDCRIKYPVSGVIEDLEKAIKLLKKLK